MKIKGSNNFTYVGYTLGGTKPTLYFKEGHYTQFHDDKTNEGWHALGKRVVIRKNIDKKTGGLILSKTTSATTRNKLLMEVAAGLHGDSSKDGLLCEVFFNENKEVVNYHVSRGRLMTPGEKDFDPKYDNAYAQNVLDNGDYAANDPIR